MDMKKQKVSMTCDGTPVSAIHLFKITKRNHLRESDIILLKSNVIINNLMQLKNYAITASVPYMFSDELSGGDENGRNEKQQKCSPVM